MQYAFLIYVEEKELATHTPERRAERFERNMGIIQEAQGRNVFGGIVRLQGTSASVTARRKGGAASFHDGPFAETKEALGGLYLIDCKDEAEARYWADRITAAGCSTAVEFRPVQDMLMADLQRQEMATVR